MTYRRDQSVAAFATSVGKAQPQDEYKVILTNRLLATVTKNLFKQTFSINEHWNILAKATT